MGHMYRFGRKTIFLVFSAVIATIVIAGALVYLGKEEGRIERSFESSFEAHRYLWGEILEEAKVDKYSKYAIYASRVLTVKHPEVYLQGDALFLRQIMTGSGYKKVYSIENIHDYESYMNTCFGGLSFSFEDVGFEAYEIVSSPQLYPENYPLFAYLDRRLFPVSTTLKTWENEITQLELAEQFYFSLKENRGAAGGLYVIYCDNEETYLYDNGELTWMKNLTKTGEIRGNPILILNEENVWYPLMERDDTTGDSVLNHIVEEYSTNVRTPHLTEFEENAIEILKQVTELDSENQVLMATIVAAHTEAIERPVEDYHEFETAWRELDIPPLAHGVFQEIYKRADCLSPITAYLAWISVDQEGENKIEAITGEYLKHAGSPTYNYEFAHGHVWNCMLVGKTIGESYRTRAGHCVWQAASISSVLDALNIRNYIIQYMFRTYHHIVLLPQHDLIVSNGAVSAIPENMPSSLAINFISSEGKWAHPRYTYIGTLSPEESINVLNFLEGKFHVSYSNLISRLEEEEWTPFKLP